MQQGDFAAVSGAASMIGLGMFATFLYNTVAGRDNPESMGQWIVEGVDRSGLMSVIMEANNMAEKTVGFPGLSRVLGDGEVTSRYRSRNTLGTLVGPLAGTVQDAASIGRSIATQEVNRGDLKAVRRILPYQNIFYLRRMLDEATEGIGDSLGLKQTKKKRKAK
jgi:hypothetical protein